jgi:FkbM family methyltransferase
MGTKKRIARFLVRLLKAVVGEDAMERLLIRACQSERRGRLLRIGALIEAHLRSFQVDQYRTARMDGYLMRVNIRERIGSSHYFWRTHMPPNAVRPLLRRGTVLLDIGSNMGSWGFYGASVMGPKGRVFAFEPNPRNAGMLGESVRANGWDDRVHVDTRAVSDVSGKALTFFLSPDPLNSGTSSLDFHEEIHESGKTMEVRTVTIDDFCSAQGLGEVGFIKIDVERAELQVMRGMKGLLTERRVDFLYVELFFGNEANRYMTSLGYSAFGIDRATGVFKPASEFKEGEFGDLLFVRPGLESAVMTDARGNQT